MKFPSKKVILITGANGQLGKEFRQLSVDQDEYEFLFTSRKTLDITSAMDVFHVFKKFRPDYCINCAAYTAVDKAESEVDIAYQINSTALRYLVNACQLYPSKLIHFSSDYVYDSVCDRPILESDDCQPKSAYAKSKRAGEIILEDSEIDWICLRISWLYSSYNQNFVKTMWRLGKERSKISVVNDQTGSPTYGRELVSAVMKIVTNNNDSHWKQHYNYSNMGITNWAEYAREIFRQSKLNCDVKGITTAEFDAPAPRPKWSVMSKDKIKKSFDITISNWRDSLSECIDLIRLNQS